MIYECPICGRLIEMTWQEHTKKLIKLLYQWKGHLTIDQVIQRQKDILKEDQK